MVSSIDDWTNHGSTYDMGTIDLVSGQRDSIKLEYYDDGAGAIMDSTGCARQE